MNPARINHPAGTVYRCDLCDNWRARWLYDTGFTLCERCRDQWAQELADLADALHNVRGEMT